MVAPSLPKALTSGGWDVVHVQSYHTFFAPTAMATAARTGIPFVLTFHGGGHSESWRNAIRATQLRILGPLAQRASALVAIAEFEIDAYSPLLGVPRERFVKIPNGAELPSVDARVVSDGKLVASIGRLEKYKGHRRVLKAFPAILASEPAARLWIAGSGPDEAHLRRLARELGIETAVEISSTDRATLAARLQGASAMVLLSEFESHPLAVLEAASLGVPAVVADNSGMLELANQGFATAVSLTSGPELHAAVILQAMEGRRKAPPGVLPTWDVCASKLAELYRGVADARSSAAGPS